MNVVIRTSVTKIPVQNILPVLIYVLVLNAIATKDIIKKKENVCPIVMQINAKMALQTALNTHNAKINVTDLNAFAMTDLLCKEIITNFEFLRIINLQNLYMLELVY